MLEYLIIGEGIYIDATLGEGGHAEAILKIPGTYILGIDVDEEALQFARNRLSRYGDRVLIRKLNFSNLEVVLKDRKFKEFSKSKKIKGVLLDLGVSSFQLDSSNRGFSFRYKEAPLDMRMDKETSLCARDILNKSSKSQLESIFREYGEVKEAKKIAEAIYRFRRYSKIETVSQLLLAIKDVLPKKSHIHPATKIFMALRIAVNNELSSIEPGIISGLKLVDKGGRICVISYHSLEDRIVKTLFRKLYRDGLVKLLTKKVIRPETEEILRNRRSRSARLRVAEKV